MLLYSFLLLPRDWDDKFVWISTKNGFYLVKSKYHLAVTLFDSIVGACRSYFKALHPFGINSRI